MIIRYDTSIRGVRYYQVLESEDEVFMGTMGECKRFLAIHNEKVVRRMEMERASRAVG